MLEAGIELSQITWCSDPESNREAVKRQILSLLCLPISSSEHILVPLVGVEPTLANYLLHTGYKSAVLPLNYRGLVWGDV